MVLSYSKKVNRKPSGREILKHLFKNPISYNGFVCHYKVSPREFVDSLNIQLIFIHRQVDYEDKDIMNAYIDLYNKLKRAPTFADIDKESKLNSRLPSVGTIIKRFKTLENLASKCEIKTITQKNGKYKDEHLISELKRFYKEFGRIPMQVDFEKIKGTGYPSRKSFANHFGSFNDALKAAGFDIEEKPEYTRDYLLSEIYRFIEEFERQPSSNDMDRTKGYPSKSNYQKVFGSWNNATQEAGFKPLSNRYTDEDLKNSFFAFVEKNGRPPILHEFNDSNGEYPSFWCYQSRFGSWGKTLMHYGFPPNQGTAGRWTMFDNEELCKSSFEFDVSTWLRAHDISYLRNVPYKDFLEDYEGRKDCDYVILHNGEQIWLEVAGLYPSRNNYSCMEANYKKSFDHKVSELLTNFNYHIFYPKDFKEKTLDEMFSFLFEIPRPKWLTYEEIYSGVGDEYEVREVS